MAEGTYEYECNRAELLGIDPPDKATFVAAQIARLEEEKQKEMLNEANLQDEQINQTSGRFDELNNILSVTQRRINKFKIACGSLTNLLKIRPNQETGLSEAEEPCTSSSVTEPNSKISIDNAETTIDGALENLDKLKTEEAKSNVTVLKQSTMDMQQKMSCQFDKLDSMLSKAENAQYSMAKQTKDMKRIMK